VQEAARLSGRNLCAHLQSACKSVMDQLIHVQLRLSEEHPFRSSPFCARCKSFVKHTALKHLRGAKRKGAIIRVRKLKLCDRERERRKKPTELWKKKRSGKRLRVDFLAIKEILEQQRKSI